MSSIPVVTTGSSLAQNIWGTITGDDRLTSAATTAEGLEEAIGEISAAFDGSSMRIGACREDYASCDEEQADALNKLLIELGT